MCNQIFVLLLGKTNFRAVKVRVLQSHKNGSTKQNIFANFRIAGWDVITFAKKTLKQWLLKQKIVKMDFLVVKCKYLRQNIFRELIDFLQKNLLHFFQSTKLQNQ